MPEAIEDQSLSSDELLDLLSEDDLEEEETKEDKEGEETKEEDKEEEDKDDDKDDKEDKEDEEEDEDEDEGEEEEIVVNIRRQEIVKKYPKFFKEFPGVEKAIYRDREYAELFGTIDNAKEVQERAEILDEHEKSLMRGDIQGILTAVKEGDKDAFSKLADNYLEVLGKVDQNAYFHVLGDFGKKLIISMVDKSKKTDNKQLQAAATLVNEHLFGTTEFQPIDKLSKSGDSSERDQLEEDRAEFMRERFETAKGSLFTRVNNIMRSFVDKNIDPKDAMTAYVKKTAMRDTMEALDEVIREDTDFMKTIDKLWGKARDAKFSEASIRKIRGVFISKAKTHLPAVIKRIRRDALKDSGKKVTTRKRRSPDEDGRHGITSDKSSRDKSKDGRGMSTYDFLNQ